MTSYPCEPQSHPKVVTERGKRPFALDTISTRELFEKAHDAIWIQDLEGKVIAANQATTELTGYEADEFIGKNVAQFLPPKDSIWQGKLGESYWVEKRLPSPMNSGR